VPHADFETEFDYDCDMTTGFVPNPKEQKRVGYLVSFAGLETLTLKPDLGVFVPYNASGPTDYKGITLTPATDPTQGRMPTAQVVGVMEKFTWRGGICDAITIDFYVSQQNALLIKQLVQAALKSTAVTTLAYWICSYDDETKQWFEQAFPADDSGIVTGHINGRAKPILEAHLTPTKVSADVDVNVYKAKVSIVPMGETLHNLCFAASPKQNVVRQWGLAISGVQAPP